MSFPNQYYHFVGKQKGKCFAFTEKKKKFLLAEAFGFA